MRQLYKFTLTFNTTFFTRQRYSKSELRAYLARLYRSDCIRVKVTYDVIVHIQGRATHTASHCRLTMSADNLPALMGLVGWPLH